MIDFLSLRAREYTFLTRMFEEWEVSCQHTTPVRDEAELRDTLLLGLSPPSWAGGRQLCHRAWGFCNWLSPLGLSHGQAGIRRLSEQPLEAEVFMLGPVVILVPYKQFYKLKVAYSVVGAPSQQLESNRTYQAINPSLCAAQPR